MSYSDPLENKRTSLYRFFDGGKLLYVGITPHLPGRLREHDRQKNWWEDVSTVLVEHYPCRSSARAAELHAINTENPRYNVGGREDDPIDLSSLIFDGSESTCGPDRSSLERRI